MNLYFKTKKETPTGVKITELVNRLDTANNQAHDLGLKYGFENYRTFSGNMISGISSVVFKEQPDMSVWKKVRENEYAPKLSNPKGKAIQIEFDAIPKIHRREINACINWDGGIIYFVGLNFNHEDYFGIVVDERWKINMPSDCCQVTKEEYNKLFPANS